MNHPRKLSAERGALRAHCTLQRAPWCAWHPRRAARTAAHAAARAAALADALAVYLLLVTLLLSQMLLVVRFLVVCEQVGQHRLPMALILFVTPLFTPDRRCAQKEKESKNGKNGRGFGCGLLQHIGSLTDLLRPFTTRLRALESARPLLSRPCLWKAGRGSGTLCHSSTRSWSVKCVTLSALQGSSSCCC